MAKTFSVKVEVDMDHPQIKLALEVARQEGLDQGRREMIDWLEHKYIDDPKRPERNEPRAEAILELAREAARHLSTIDLPKVTKKKGKKK